MSSQPVDPLSMGPVSATELPFVLRLLFDRLDPQVRAAQIAAVLASIDESSGQNQILAAGRRRGQIVAAVWLQIRPGRVGSLQSIGIAEQEPDETAIELIQMAVSRALVAGVNFVQSLTETDAGRLARWLQSSGFQHAADLLYLASPRTTFPPIRIPSKLEFQPFGESTAASARLAQVIEQTCQDSEDCPAIHGVHPIGDALTSFKATGEFDPSRWFIVRKEQFDIGCLLLTEQPASSFPIPHSPLPNHARWELIYMGLVPEARGHGYGIEIVRHAQWVAGRARAARLELAVDAANEPAIRVYSAAGFETWDRRSVFLRTK